MYILPFLVVPKDWKCDVRIDMRRLMSEIHHKWLHTQSEKPSIIADTYIQPEVPSLALSPSNEL